MNNITNQSLSASPVVIGGIGGSGTRLIAQSLIEMGYFMGNDLNVSIDNLLFTHLFKHANILEISTASFQTLVDLFLKDMTNEEALSIEHLDRVNNIFQRDLNLKNWVINRANAHLPVKQKIKSQSPWGWKEPNSHIVIERLFNHIDNLKYIHVIRNGFDMAHSNNQNQLAFWGDLFINKKIEITPFYSLKYWCLVHKKIFKLHSQHPNNILILNYENFCFNTDVELNRIYQFLDIHNEYKLTNFEHLIQPPKSIGRYKKYGIDIFDKRDVDFIQSYYSNRQHE